MLPQPNRTPRSKSLPKWRSPRRASKGPATATSALPATASNSRATAFRRTAAETKPTKFRSSPISSTSASACGSSPRVSGGSPLVTAEEIARITREAVVVAKANSALQASPVQLAPTKAYTDRWRSTFEKDPFAVAVDEKLELMHNATLIIKKDPKVFAAFGFLAARAEDKYFASSEGSSIQQYIVQVFPALQATAVDIQKNISRTRSYQTPPVTAGWEAVAKANLAENAPRIRAEVLEHLAAPPVTPGKKDLVLLPSHLWLTIHESIGHSTELDRALGYEANFAGTSFLTTDKMGKFQVGSELINIFGDRTNEGGLATVKYDDDGVLTTKFPIIEKGIFKHYQTIRDQAH